MLVAPVKIFKSRDLNWLGYDPAIFEAISKNEMLVKCIA
jgi:hypothetical protein